MKNWIVIASIVTVIGTAGAGLAQMQHSTGQRPNHGSNQTSNHSALTAVMAHATPAFKERLYKTGQFTEAALTAIQSGNYALAETKARQALASGPDSGINQEILAAALDAQGKSQEALQAYRVIADSGDGFPRNLLPYALLELKAGHWPQAAAAYNKALPLVGNGQINTDLMRKIGDFSPDVPRPTDLATALHVALGLEMDWWGYHGTYQAKLQQSLVHFQQAVALEPNSSLANYYDGYGLKLVGRQAEAQAAFRKAAALGGGEIKELAQKELPIAENAR